MITGSKEITKELLLSKVSEYDIFRYYFPEIKLNHPICNPYRNDKNPSLIIGDKNGFLYAIDFAMGSFRGDVYQIVGIIKGTDFKDTVKAIWNDFRLGTKEAVKIEWEQPKIKKIDPPLIQVKLRDTWNKAEIEYWRQYGLEREDLNHDNCQVLVPKELLINRRRIPINQLTFVYYFKDIQKFKIYRPNASKKDKTVQGRKWTTNVPFQYIFNQENIKQCFESFMCKSMKEFFLLRKILQTNCIVVISAENPAALNIDVVEKMKKDTIVQYCVSDNDCTGKSFSWYLTNNFDFKHINIPDKYLEEGLTDLADMCKKEGYEFTKQFILNKI